MIDGVFAVGEDGQVHFAQATALTSEDLAAVQQQVRARVLRWFARAGTLDPADAQDMAGWHHGGGFSLDAAVRIEGLDRAGLERLLRYCARPPFALERLEHIGHNQLLYRCHRTAPQLTAPRHLSRALPHSPPQANPTAALSPPATRDTVGIPFLFSLSVPLVVDAGVGPNSDMPADSLRLTAGAELMHVFLSYASENRPRAEEIALALKADGHDVFFDSAKLSGGESYHQVIRKQIAETDLLLFLISPDSVQPGSYTLTELRMAEERWTSPAGHVVPILLEPTTMSSIPAYLRAVTIFEPKGNAAAEIAAHVARLARRRKPLLWSAAAVAFVAIAVGSAVWLHNPRRPAWASSSFRRSQSLNSSAHS